MVLRRDPAPTAGQLNSRAALQMKTSTATGGTSGTGMAEAFTTLGHAWCAIELLRGGRYVAGKQTEEVATHRVMMRYRDDYQEWRYLLVGTSRYRVQTIGDPDRSRKWLVAMVEQLNP